MPGQPWISQDKWLPREGETKQREIKEEQKQEGWSHLKDACREFCCVVQVPMVAVFVHSRAAYMVIVFHALWVVHLWSGVFVSLFSRFSVNYLGNSFLLN